MDIKNILNQPPDRNNNQYGNVSIHDHGLALLGDGDININNFQYFATPDAQPFLISPGSFYNRNRIRQKDVEDAENAEETQCVKEV